MPTSTLPNSGTPYPTVERYSRGRGKLKTNTSSGLAIKHPQNQIYKYHLPLPFLGAAPSKRKMTRVDNGRHISEPHDKTKKRDNNTKTKLLELTFVLYFNSISKILPFWHVFNIKIASEIVYQVIQIWCLGQTNRTSQFLCQIFISVLDLYSNLIKFKVKKRAIQKPKFLQRFLSFPINELSSRFHI